MREGISSVSPSVPLSHMARASSPDSQSNCGYQRHWKLPRLSDDPYVGAHILPGQVQKPPMFQFDLRLRRLLAYR
jgi:hypothetical protein